jgi:hypothetical protein
MVMEMAKNCRFCGEELDEETFFLNEAAMLEEVMAIRKESEQTKAAQERLARHSFRFKTAALVALVLSGSLMLVDNNAVKVVAGLSAVAGVVLAVLGLRAAKRLESMAPKRS